MNFVILSGTLADDPRFYPNKPDRKNNKPDWAILNLKCRNPRTGKSTDWHFVYCQGPVAKAAHEHLHEGMKITVIGQVGQSSWKDGKTGQWRKRMQITAWSIQLSFHQWTEEWLDLALHLAAQASAGDEETEIDTTEEDS